MSMRRGLSGVKRQSAGSQDSVTDRFGARQLSFSSTLGPRCSRGNSAGFFPPIDEEPHHSLISLRSVTVQSDIGSGSRRTGLSTISLSLAINAAATQRNVQLCTELDVLGGQQGSLEVNGCQTNWQYNIHKREVTRHGKN